MKLTKTDECSIEHSIHGIRDEMLRCVLLRLVDDILEVFWYLFGVLGHPVGTLGPQSRHFGPQVAKQSQRGVKMDQMLRKGGPIIDDVCHFEANMSDKNSMLFQHHVFNEHWTDS